MSVEFHISLKHSGHGLRMYMNDIRSCVFDPSHGIWNGVNDHR